MRQGIWIRRGARRLATAAAAGCLALALAPAAQAGLIDYYEATEWSAPSVTFTDAAAERNRVVVSTDAQDAFIVAEEGPAPLAPGPDTSAVGGFETATLEYCSFGIQVVRCVKQFGYELLANRVDLGVGNDEATLMAPATVVGGDGNDYLVGSDGVDVLDGERGRDILLGGPGGDHLYTRHPYPDPENSGDILRGQAGEDEIHTRDGYRDEVNCGPGYDRAWVDLLDWVNADCEEVSRALVAGGAASA